MYVVVTLASTHPFLVTHFVGFLEEKTVEATVTVPKDMGKNKRLQK